ncbi:MAG: type II toxin-antitoxin system RelE/ParE family toxin [Elusimicrobiales bacterium]|nr:type II toxin-antitoxin system RelE/ParE family toxin [Elusimicrobiales bacterium]
MDVYYFVDGRGNAPVEEFIDILSPDEQAKAFAYIAELRKQGHNLRRPLAAPVKNGIYELRPKSNRLFYFFFHRDYIILVHAIRKKTDAVPQRDIDLALRRKVFIEQHQSQPKLAKAELL